MIDAEPHYDNFTAIQNALRQYDETQPNEMVSLIFRFSHLIGNHVDGVFSQLFN